VGAISLCGPAVAFGSAVNERGDMPKSLRTAILLHIGNGFRRAATLEHSAKGNQPMKRTIRSGLLAALLPFFMASLVYAEGKEDKSLKALEVTKSTPKVEVRDSQIGYRDTLLFYSFADRMAVLMLQIGNKDQSFPMAGTIHVFADSVKKEDLEKWINNQHSDALYPDVPEPKSTHKLPGESCKVTSRKVIDRSKQMFGEFDNYSVTFEVKDYSDNKGVALKGFSDTAKVYVKTK
jgi:hypothetical protein